jgi:hypothetical protein
MKRIRYAGLALVVVFAMSAAAAASAGAHEFSATVMGTVKGTAKATQVFTTAAGKVECSTLSVTSGQTVLASKTETATIQYSGCKAFGLSATISPATYEFNAEGSVKLAKQISIKATACQVTVPTAGNENLKSVGYKQSGTEVVIEPNVTGITSEGTGTACTYAKESKGTYTGNSSVSVAGGTVSWS